VRGGGVGPRGAERAETSLLVIAASALNKLWVEEASP
jgi:hypothetical protein